MSKRFELTPTDRKRIGWFALVLFCTALLANISLLSTMLADFLDPSAVAFIIGMIGYIAKKFIEETPK